MAYSLRGCGVVLKSDVHKRNLAAERVGRRPVPPVVSSLFIHSRASYMGGGIGNRDGGWEQDPYLDTFLGPCNTGTNVRISLLQTMKTREGQEAAEKDAELGLNFTIASNWKNAAKKKILETDDVDAPKRRSKLHHTSPTRDNLHDADTDRIWKQSAGGNREAAPLVFRGRTASERRELSYAADAGALNKPYSAQDSRLFFGNHAARHSLALPPAVLASTMRGSVPQIPTLNLEGAATEGTASPGSPQGEKASPAPHPFPTMSVSNIFGAVPSGSSGGDRELHQHMQRQLSLPKGSGWSTERSRRKGSARSRPLSGARSARSARSASSRGMWGEGVEELRMPHKSFEEAPEEWHAFASKCFMEGRWELAKRALSALEIGQGVVGRVAS